MEKNKNLYDLKKRFLEEWPTDRLHKLTLEEYTDTERSNSFCYWVEHITRELGSIVGGSSYKFGIYKKGDDTIAKVVHYKRTDGIYAWYTKYGATKEEAFNSIKQILIDIAELAIANTIENINNIDIGDAYKWKIAFLYGNFNTINIFKIDALKRIAIDFNIPYDNHTPISTFYREILKDKPKDQDYFNYTKELWSISNLQLEGIKEEFSNWLKGNEKTNSNKIYSYLRAIEILIEITEKDIYLETNLDKLNVLYNDLIREQRTENGKYYYSKSPSYGNNGFYSASIKAFIEFLKEKKNMERNTISEIKEDFIEYLKKIN